MNAHENVKIEPIIDSKFTNKPSQYLICPIIKPVSGVKYFNPVFIHFLPTVQSASVKKIYSPFAFRTALVIAYFLPFRSLFFSFIFIILVFKKLFLKFFIIFRVLYSEASFTSIISQSSFFK